MKVRTLALILSGLFAALACLLVVDYILETAVLLDEARGGNTQNLVCRHTVGKVFVADSKGNVCKWQEVDYQTGCCSSTSEPESGVGCAENCCSEYAFCVSRCLKMESPLTSAFKSSSTQSLLGSLEKDKYQACLYTCRTDSKSVINENQFMSEFRYCYSSRTLDRQFLPSAATAKPSDPKLGEEVENKEKKPVNNGNVNKDEDEDIVDEFDSVPQKREDASNDDLAVELEKKKQELEELNTINKKLEAEREQLTELLKQAREAQKRVSENDTEDDEDEANVAVSFQIFHTLFALLLIQFILKWLW